MYLQKTPGLFLIVVLTTLVSSEHNSDQQGHNSCTNDEGKTILHGMEFIPKIDDPCTKCTCDNGYQILCHTAACSPPVGCVKTEQIPRECCKYHCLDADGNSRLPSANDSVPADGQPAASEDNITNLSLRLVASTVTSFLVLALLLFMVHRLRQRRLMLAMRRFEAQARSGHGDDDLDHYIPAEFMQIECPPYEDPPPPYSPPKPPHILPEDSPPPYEEVENNAVDQVDTNGNVNNNNNNQSCNGHRNEGTVVSSAAGERGESQHQVVVENQGRERGSPHVPDIVEGFNAASNLCHNSGQHYAGEDLFESRDNVEQTCLKAVARPGDFSNRQLGRVVDSIQRSADTSSTNFFNPHAHVASCAVNSTVGCMRMGVKRSSGEAVAGHEASSEVSAVVKELQCRGSDHGNVSRWSRQPGRSCSFSYTRTPEQDEIAAIALAPMSHSYHAATTDSGVQTLGSYTASLSRRKARAGSSGPENKMISEDGEKVTSKRMIRKPMMGCDSTVQQSHRMLQEELLRNLPPKLACHIAGSADASQGPSAPGNSASAPTDSCGNISPRPEPDGDDFSSPDHSAGSAVVTGAIPRSQSVTSTLSVCSETGEVRSKKAEAENALALGLQSGSAECSVLQSDSQYPEHRRLSQHQVHSLNSNLESSTPRGATVVSRAADFSPSRSEASGCSAKSSVVPNFRRPIINPPSQELRSGLARSHAHATKQKHGKKIHFVPLEKSKTYKSGKKDKGKSSKKGGALLESHCGPNPQQPVSDAGSIFHVSSDIQDSADARMVPQKTVDVRRGRPPAQPSVKQYGFLEQFFSPAPPPLAQDNGLEQSGRLLQDSSFDPKVQTRIAPNPYHSLPQPPVSAPPMHPMGHRRQFSHPAEKISHLNSSSSRPKLKTGSGSTVMPPERGRRPFSLSGGITVEPGCDPADPVAALPQNSIPRRKVKNVNAKKTRQSYPAQETGLCVDRKVVSGIDLGFVEPGLVRARNPSLEHDNVAIGIASKRRNGDRNAERGAQTQNIFANGHFLESHMSSYV